MSVAASDLDGVRTIQISVSSRIFARIVEAARKAKATPAEYVRAMYERGEGAVSSPSAELAQLREDLSAARQAEAQLRVTLAARERDITVLMDTASERSQTQESATNRAQARRIAEITAERDDARAEAFRWRRSAEGANRENARLEGEIGALRRTAHDTETLVADLRHRLAEMEKRAEGLVPPAPSAPAPVRLRDMVDRGRDEAPRSDADDLTPAFVRSVVGFHTVGNGPAAIARLMRCDIAAVRRALDRRR